MTKQGRKGFTLAELAVVLAVLAVISGMVVTFTLMAGSSSEISSARLSALQDIRVAEAIIEGFVSSNDATVDINTVTENGRYTTLTKGDSSLSFDSNEKKLIIKNGQNGENGSSLELQKVTSIEFEVVEQGTDKIYYCFITYHVAGKDYNYNFCVNPIVGEGADTGGN